MAHTNEEILLSSVCDRVMAFCNKLNKRLDKLDEQQHAHHQCELTQPVQPFHPYLPAQPHSFHSADQPWQQTYQFGVPSWEEPTLHSQPPGPNTQPWQQPPDPPDWQRNSQPQPYGSHDFGTMDLVVPGHSVTAVFRAETYTVPVTMEPPRTSLTNHQIRLNAYTQPHTSCNTVDWYQPPCWEPPSYQPPQEYPRDDQHPAHQTSWWEPLGNHVHLGYSQYGQQHYQPTDYGEPPTRRPTCWDPPLYGQPPYTDTESLNAPLMQYTASTFGQSPYSSNAPPQNSYVGFHSGLPEYQSTPPPYQPPSSPTCWDPPKLGAPQGYTAYDQPVPADCPPPCTTDSGCLLRPSLLHDPSTNSLPIAAVVPPPPAVISSPCIPDLSGEEEEVLLDDEEKVGSFANLRVTRVRGEKCSSLVKGDQNELRAHCFTFGTLEELVHHSPPIGEDLHGQKEILEQQTYVMKLNQLVTIGLQNDVATNAVFKDEIVSRKRKRLCAANVECVKQLWKGVAFAPRQQPCIFDPGGDIPCQAFVIGYSLLCYFVFPP